MTKGTTLDAGAVCSAALDAGERVRITNVPGDQVIDTWAFASADEFMSMEHSRAWWLRLRPEIGSVFITNRHNEILRLVADTSAGEHDTLIAACNPDRYRVLGAEPGHANCQDNLHRELAVHGIATAVTPCPLNLFMNIPSEGENGLRREPPTKTPGAFVELVAVMPARVIFSACPMDLLPINGEDGPKAGVVIGKIPPRA